MYKFNLFDKISFVLVIIGAITWCIFGLTADFNLIRFIFGNLSPTLERVIYILIGVSGINLLVMAIKVKK